MNRGKTRPRDRFKWTQGWNEASLRVQQRTQWRISTLAIASVKTRAPSTISSSEVFSAQ
jgi:hypothetical protein